MLDPVVAAFVDSSRSEYHLAAATVFPALAHWGVPHRVVDLAGGAEAVARSEGCGLLLVAQEYLGEPLADHLGALMGRVRAGAGWVNMDHALATYPRAYHEGLCSPDGLAETSTEDVVVSDLGHALCAGQRAGARFRLKQPIPALEARFEGGEVPVCQDSGRPALVATTLGAGRAVQWAVSPKLWHPDFLGLAHGLDGLLWRGLVWAAPKPFVLHALPPFVRYRFDDCYGHWREPADLAFVDEFAARGHTPSVCFCLRAPSAQGAAHAAALHRAGRLELSPHTLAPGVSLYYGRDGGEYTTEDLRAVFAELDEVERRWEVRWSPILSDHEHEWSARAVPFLRERGTRFKMNITLPGEQWTSVHTDYRPAPYGSMDYALGPLPEPWDDFFVVFNHHPSFSSARVYLDGERFVYHRPGGFGKQKWDFLNGLVGEGRTGPETLAAAAERVEEHTRIGLDSLFFGGSITHSHFTRHLAVGQWRELLDDAERRLRHVEQVPAAYADIARYAEAHAATSLVDVRRTAGGLRCELTGVTAQALRLSVFDEHDGVLVRSEQPVAPFEGRVSVDVPLARSRAGQAGEENER